MESQIYDNGIFNAEGEQGYRKHWRVTGSVK